MSFYRKYELERLVQKAEPKTFRAHEAAGGRPVYLHLLAGMDAAARASLLERVRGLVAAGNPAILDVDDNEFAPYVATVVLEDFDGLPAWLGRLSQTPALPPDGRPTETIARPYVPPPPAAPPPTPPAYRAPVPAPAPPPLAPAVEPGEFTVRFGSAEKLRPRPEAASGQPPAAPPPAPPVYRAPAPAPAPPPAAAAAEAIEAGEFTKMFTGSPGRPASPAQPAAPPLPPPAAAPAPPAAPVGSEFSKLFGHSPLGQPMPPAGGEGPGEFSRLFGAPPGEPADNPAGFAPQAPVKPRQPDAPLPWELPPGPPPQAVTPPPAAAPPQSVTPAPLAPPRPRVETPDTQKMRAYVPPPTPPPAPPPALEQSASMWNSPPPPGPSQNRPDSSGPGEFTRFFASPLASSSLPIEDIEQGRMPEAKASADRPFDGPGEFTRWFGKSAPGDKTPPPAPPAQFPTYAGRATGLFEMPQFPGPPGTAGPAGPAGPRGPSEYTGVMAAPRIEEPVAYVPAPAPGKGPLIAIIVVIAVVVVALVVLVILYLKH